jgi:lambda family phage portal protein
MGKRKKPQPKPTPVPARSYAGASFSRLTSDWIGAGSTSADSEIYTASRTLRNRSRDLIRNNDYLKGAANTIVDNVIGECGVGFQSQVKNRKGELERKINTQIEEAWEEWAESGCDVREKLAFPDMEALILRSLIESGEVLVRVISQPFGDSNIPFSLELIEADQLCDDYSIQNAAGNMVKMGVELDQWNRAIAYHLYQNHPGDYQFQSSFKYGQLIRVPANQIFHLYLFDRVGQTRGVPWLASSLLRSKHLSGFEEAELIKARGQASFMGFLQTPEPNVMGEEDENGQIVSDFSPGEIFQLQPGQQFQGFQPTSPGQQFDPFVKMMLRGIAAGLGMSYESLSKNFSDVNYSSARQAILAERDAYKKLQKWFIRSFRKPLYKMWLQMAVLSGALKLNDFEINRKYYCRPKFVPRRWDWVDPNKDISAKVTAINEGVMSLTQVIAETGRDIEEVLAEKAQEKILKENLGLTEKPEPIIQTAKDWRQREQLRRVSEIIFRG